MTEFTSNIKIIPQNRQKVYEILSDMERLEHLKAIVPGNKMYNFSFEKDAVSFPVNAFGTLKVSITDRQAPETVQYVVTGAPVDAQIEVHLLPGLLPDADTETQVQLVAKAELNPFIKPMVAKPMQDGINKLVEILKVLPYDRI